MVPSFPLDGPSSTFERLVDRWERNALTRPSHEALRADGHLAMTYRDLSDQAHQWSQSWADQGLVPGDRVLIQGPLGPTWVVAVWASWLLGLVWTSCASSLSPVHQQAIIDDLDPRLIVASPNLLGPPVFHHRFASRHASPSLAACILYPENPKTMAPGSVLLHDGMVPMIEDLLVALKINEDTVLLEMLSPMHPACWGTVAAVLAGGGTVVVEPSQAWAKFEAWERLVVRHRITMVDLPPSWMNVWNDRLPPFGLSTVVAHGSALHAMLRSWSSRVRWINTEGSCEVALCTSLERRRAEEGAAVLLPIGRPLAGMAYRVVPPGAASPAGDAVHLGELWVGGPGVALGYWRDPGLTAQFFWTDEQGQRWFRTGLRVRRTGVHLTVQPHSGVH